MGSVNGYNRRVKTGRYVFSVEVTERFWEGNDSGKMEDMPGTFLDTKVVLLGISGNLSTIEQLAVENKIYLFKETKEITNLPRGYSRLYYDDLIEKIKSNPEHYMRNLRARVKEIL